MNLCVSSLRRRLPHSAVTHRFASSSVSHCPFKVLGLKSPSPTSNLSISIPTTMTTYKEVQLAFRKLALRYHPDTANNNSRQQHNGDESSDHNNGVVMMSSSSFTEIREAFEAIVEGPNGEAILRNNNNYSSMSSSDDENYDKNEMDIRNNNHKRPPPPHDISNNLFHSSINPQILREVAQVAEEMNPGGLDKGGMWQYANMVNRMAKEEGLPPLRVGKGGDDNESRSGVARRRRKRR
mmetsp:Transcript_5109/g.8416  ORF Transcript_5109/g.8416 Transcript_5109/m.8416 type:complete len:238 (-) Transcript_5109:68-781(-)